MDENEFNKLAGEMDAKINTVDAFIRRAHDEGISTIEAMAMQNHVRREFSPKRRVEFREGIADLYRRGKITIGQKDRMDKLLDKASKISDEHFLRLSKIIPEGGALKAPKPLPRFFDEELGDTRAKRVLRFLGFRDDRAS